MVFELIRRLTCNFEQIEEYVPKQGKILDVGCGHGIFSRMLTYTSKKRTVLGIDPSENKIRLAKKNNLQDKRIEFRKGYLADVKGKFDALVIVDVLYLFPYKEKLNFLKIARQKIVKNGKLVIVINGREPRWVYNILKIQEKIMTSCLKITYTDFDKTYFEDKRDMSDLLKKAGFKIEKTVKIKSFLPYPHILFSASLLKQ